MAACPAPSRKWMKTGKMATSLACPLLYSRGSVCDSASSLATEPRPSGRGPCDGPILRSSTERYSEPGRHEALASRVCVLASHPVIPILVGAALTWDTAGNLLVKSYTLAALFLWLCIDISIWIWPKRTLFRYALWATLCCVSGIMQMLAMRYLLSTKLEEQQSDVQKNLKMVMFSTEQHGAELTITLTNGGSSTIGKHSVKCIPNVLSMKDGGGMNTKNGQNGSGIYGFIDEHPAAELLFKGDSETDTCFKSTAIRFMSPIECGDVTVEVNYVLESQPQMKNAKRFRFVTMIVNGKSYWAQQPIDFIDTSCVIHAGPVKKLSR